MQIKKQGQGGKKYLEKKLTEIFHFESTRIIFFRQIKYRDRYIYTYTCMCNPCNLVPTYFFASFSERYYPSVVG